MTDSKLEKRITELEIRITHLEDTENILNDIIIKQQEVTTQLNNKVIQLQKRLETFQEQNIANESEETPPPHY